MHSGPARITSIGSMAARSTPAASAALGGGDHAVPRDRVGEPQQPTAQIFFDLGDDAVLCGEVVLVPDLAFAGDLEVVVVRASLAERTARQRDHAAAGERNADADHTRASFGVQPGEGPRDRCAPVVPDHDRLLLAVGVDDAENVAGQFLYAVSRLHAILRRTPVSPLVDGDRAVAGLGERGELVPPGVPGLREPVDQHHQRSLALFHSMDPGAPAVEHPMNLRPSWSPLFLPFSVWECPPNRLPFRRFGSR